MPPGHHSLHINRAHVTHDPARRAWGMLLSPGEGGPVLCVSQSDRRDDGGHFVVLESLETEPTEAIPPGAAIQFTYAAVQQLFDDMWSQGLRPTAERDDRPSEGEVQWMRSLVDRLVPPAVTSPAQTN